MEGVRYLVLYGCETWSSILGEEHRLRVYENRVLRRIFGLKREEVAGDWRRLHNEELHNLYTSPNVTGMIRSRRMKWEEHVARMRAIRNAHNIFAGKPEVKRPLGRTRRRWEDNFRTELRENRKVRCRLDSSGSGQVCEHSNEPSVSIKSVKVKMSLSLTKCKAMKTYWGSGGISPRIL
jgi:glutamate synthase domain-containing protein 2